MERLGIIANIILIMAGIILGVVFYEDHKDLSLIMFSIALASILYQFLGGIQEDNSVQLGAIKFGGSAAILIGFMFFFKKFIFVPNASEYNLEIYPDNKWIPISEETGAIKQISISNNKDTLQFPNPKVNDHINSRKQHQYRLFEQNESNFYIALNNSSADTVGTVNIHNFKTNKLFNQLKVSDDEKRIQIFELYPEIPEKNSSRKLTNIHLPFEIKVFNTSRFSILSDYSKGLENREVVKRTSYIVPVSESESYIVFLEQADSEHRNLDKRFSKWLVKKLERSLE